MTRTGAGDSITARLYALYKPKYPLVKSTSTGAAFSP
jgi:hypothetical protein